jgi:hypothetical protein
MTEYRIVNSSQAASSKGGELNDLRHETDVPADHAGLHVVPVQPRAHLTGMPTGHAAWPATGSSASANSASALTGLVAHANTIIAMASKAQALGFIGKTSFSRPRVERSFRIGRYG